MKAYGLKQQPAVRVRVLWYKDEQVTGPPIAPWLEELGFPVMDSGI